jgi:hypothetical protein
MREREREKQRLLDPDYDRKARIAGDIFNNLRPVPHPLKPPPLGDLSNGEHRPVFVEPPSSGRLIPRHPSLWRESPLSTEQIRKAQERLAELGYLDHKVDVDGKIGPKTRDALTRFQSEHSLARTGRLDLLTDMELNSPRWANLFRQDDPIRLSLKDLMVEDSRQFRLEDKSGNVVFEGGDHAQLAAKLNELLFHEGHPVVYLETSGWSDNALDALASSLRIQQHPIDPSVSVGVVTDAARDSAGSGKVVAGQDILSTPGIRLERGRIPIERVEFGADAGKIRTTLNFTVGTGWNVRRITTQILCASAQFLVDFLQNLHVLKPAVSSDRNLSLKELVHRALGDMKKAHPGLTDEQLRVLTRTQSGTIRLGELRREKSFAWS